MRWLTLFAPLAVLLLACSIAGAQADRRLYLPLAADDPTPTATATATPAPTPTPLTDPPGLRVTHFVHEPTPGTAYPHAAYRIENTGTTTYYDVRLTIRYYAADGTRQGGGGRTARAMLRPGEFSTRGSSAYILIPPGWARYEVGSILASTESGGVRYVHDGLDVVDVASTPRVGGVDFGCTVVNRTGRDLRSLTVDFSAYAPDGRIVASEWRIGPESFPAGAETVVRGSAVAPEDAVPAGYGHSCQAEAREP